MMYALSLATPNPSAIIWNIPCALNHCAGSIPIMLETFSPYPLASSAYSPIEAVKRFKSSVYFILSPTKPRTAFVADLIDCNIIPTRKNLVGSTAVPTDGFSPLFPFERDFNPLDKSFSLPIFLSERLFRDSFRFLISLPKLLGK